MILRNRFPNKHTTFKTFIAVAFPVHIWAIVATLHRFPSYLLYLKISEILGIVAYTLSFALLESIIITILLIVIGAGLPQRIFKEKIVPQAALLTPVALVVADSVQSLGSTFQVWIAIWAFGMIPILIIVYLVGKSQMVSEWLTKYIDRITVLSLVYVFGDLLAVVIVICRNLF
jgi:hypothetical protein